MAVPIESVQSSNIAYEGICGGIYDQKTSNTDQDKYESRDIYIPPPYTGYATTNGKADESQNALSWGSSLSKLAIKVTNTIVGNHKGSEKQNEVPKSSSKSPSSTDSGYSSIVPSL